jgi:hypothetical protein
MAFTSPFPIETDEHERDRLAQAAEGSISHELSLLPVLNPFPTRGQVLELTRDYHGARIIVAPLNFRPGATSGAKWINTPSEQRPSRIHDGTWSCIVLASTHESYPVGDYDLIVSVSELRRARPLALLEDVTR